jgi:hypothetical protein
MAKAKEEMVAGHYEVFSLSNKQAQELIGLVAEEKVFKQAGEVTIVNFSVDSEAFAFFENACLSNQMRNTFLEWSGFVGNRVCEEGGYEQFVKQLELFFGEPECGRWIEPSNSATPFQRLRNTDWGKPGYASVMIYCNVLIFIEL